MSSSSDSLGQPPETEAAEKAKWLRDEIKRHNRQYHEFDTQEIQDEEYDALFRQLRDLEAAYPALVTPDSPTQSVSGPPSSAFSSVEHGTPMLSLDNVFNSKEMEAFDRRLADRLPEEAEREYSAPGTDSIGLFHAGWRTMCGDSQPEVALPAKSAPRNRDLSVTGNDTRRGVPFTGSAATDRLPAPC